VIEAVRQTGANTLFLRAGQIDYREAKLSRIRCVTGSIPRNIAVHLVYNGTRSFLKEFERISSADAVRAILSALAADLDRAEDDQAKVIGLQLDFDVPTRLLPNYTAILKNIRDQLPKELQLSITGLPTWLDSSGLGEPLSACDFWVPQCYGAQIPERLDQRIPITNPDFVARSVSRTRDMGVPFYAGLAAYGYAIHYSGEGLLIGIRGDFDPLLVVGSPDFEMTDQTPFSLNDSETGQKKAWEWRCTLRARRDVLVDGTAISAGEWLLLDRPTAAGLRACAKNVREHAGAPLLGICVFRIPSKGDSTTLTLPEIASALSDAEPRFSLEARCRQPSGERLENKAGVVLELENNGSAASPAGGCALSILVRVPAGSLESVLADRQVSVQPLFESGDEAVLCALKRANAVRLSVGWWPPGAKLTARFEPNVAALTDIRLRYATTLDDGSVLAGSRMLTRAGMK
jgi:hypothetical protein